LDECGIDGRAMLSTPAKRYDELPAEVEHELWRLHRLENDSNARARLVDHYLPYARIIAAKLYAGRHHEQFEFDEYLQFATVGLMESVERFDWRRGVQFKTFASQRMIGAVLNGLESLSEKQAQIKLRQRLAGERLAALQDRPLPEVRMPDQLFHYLAELGIGMALGYLLEGTGMVDGGNAATAATQYDGVELKQLQRRMRTLLAALPAREQQVIRYHYLQSIPFHEIADMIGVTKGRVSQIHRNALDLLRKKMAHTPSCDIAW
jgi:RNA polymerase sigma factor for flagellar operon FliA